MTPTMALSEAADRDLARLETAVLLNPSDELSVLALADWYEERGEDSLAEFLRLDLTLRRLSRELNDELEGTKKGREEKVITRHLALRRPSEERLQALLRSGVRTPLPRLRLAGGLFEFAPVPAGDFLMGSDSPQADADEKPRHPVLLSPDFYAGVTPVTQEQWQWATGENPSHFSRFDDSPKRPVEQVDWNACKQFCVDLTAKLAGELIAKLGADPARPELPAFEFSLPTEAEWEYMARSGIHCFERHLGDSEEDIKAACHCNSSKGTTPVGLLVPNVWGLHDCLGQVWEWCLDHYDADEYARRVREAD